MNTPRRQRIGAAFSAAQSYDRHAGVQRTVAHALAARIAALDLPAGPRILEIGCGTGFLTEALIEQKVVGEWLITDLAPTMVARCRDRIGDAPARHFAVLDGEYGPRPEGAPFDLICSSLALQWFDDIAAAADRLRGWLAPGGHLIFTTLAAATFAEWRAAHEALGLAAGTTQFPPAAAFGPESAAERHVEHHASAREFLHALKAIGAGTAAAGHQPLRPADLRRVIARFDEAGSAVTYEVVTCYYRTEGAA